ncbi:helix-turn-helix domain-containing protein [Mycobacterium sp. OTB74]|jgi:DNA-binding transcriptional ArsR family regulator|uniref:ArsR/SmtB family transcription factor n=1 Tax=Mycobacterium sp. OTB74 TaxID=1853452 RepID=UPI0024739AD7|nr:helix-turn-helix domain-containing protein [Mycobacterium sp. OTB74]MDH6243845.1 DNA-binding transcriptional ArsR family regulator [Mycobacterium sp. OTB74]
MVVDSFTDEEIDRIFHALADATRRDIVTRTMHSDQSVSALARGYDMSFAAVQKHVAVLTAAALVRKERRGREQLVRAVPETLRRAEQLLQRYEALWRDRATAIEAILAEDGYGPNQPRGHR